MMATAQAVINKAREYLGVKEGTVAHHRIIDAYNQVRPVPVGYMVKYSDDWCDAFVSFIADKTQTSELIGRECGVQRHINIFEKLGIWRGKEFPKMGDVVTFDWDSNGWADHIGFVEKVENNQITTIEGNSNGRVERNTFLWNDKRIKGYARPKYKIIGEIKKTIEEVAKEVISGKWSSGQERINELLAAGYDASLVQKKVNEVLTSVDKGVDNGALPVMTYNGATLSEKHIKKIVELAKEYNILPSLLIVMLHFEGVWGESNVAEIDNNWGGMTWSDSYVGNPKINKNKGSKRPTNEGGHYIKYSSVKDFLEDWVYLLRPGGNYRVSGISNFKQAVKGLFREGGAKYNYAALGYAKYLERMVARKLAIDKENSGILDQLDSTFSNITKKLKVKEEAYRWFTGEKIPDWVKDLEFELIEEKEVMQTIYLLGNDGISIGWIDKSDVT
ncbi:CHAP domain-containing protein [Ruoffia sp. FAM 26254]|uniref:CHAP domain-containing protein n=3 Tax=Ruoffia TaxID=2862144 RepID=UPI0038861986